MHLVEQLLTALPIHFTVDLKTRVLVKQRNSELRDKFLAIDTLIAHLDLNIVNDIVEGEVVLQEAILEARIQFLANA